MANIKGLESVLEKKKKKNTEERKKQNTIQSIKDIVNRIDANWSKRDIVKFVHVELGKVLLYDNSYSSNMQDKSAGNSDITQVSKSRRENLLQGDTRLDTDEQICKGMAEISAAIFNGLGIDAKVIGVEEKGDIEGEIKEDTNEEIIVPEIYSAEFDENTIATGRNEQTKQVSTKANHYYTQINIDGEEPIIEDYLIEKALSRIKTGESTINSEVIPGLCSKEDYKARSEIRNPITSKEYRKKIITELHTQYGDKISVNDKVNYVFEKMQQEDFKFGFEEANDCFNFMMSNILEKDDIKEKPIISNLIKESETNADVVRIYNINGQNYFIRGNLDRFQDLSQIGEISEDSILNLLENGFEVRGFKDKELIDNVVRNKEEKRKILSKQREIYQGDMEREDNNGNIKQVDITTLSGEELENVCFHQSLKKDKNSIDGEGLKSGVGRNSKGIDKEEAIYFSYGMEAVLETWDVWLKWRANRLFNPFYQEKYKNTREKIENGKASEQEKKEYYYNCKKWNSELINGEYKQDKEKLRFLYDFQMEEMQASNYYMLDLKEGEEFSFDEIDKKKEANLTKKDKEHDISYKMFLEMYGKYSDFETTKVDKWNMNTFLGKKINIGPDRIKQLTTPDGKNNVLSVITYLYEKYKEITPKEQQVQFDLLDNYMEYVKERTQDKDYHEFNRNDRIDEINMTAHFHDQKSDTYFQDKSNGIYSIAENISSSIMNSARKDNQIARDVQRTQSEIKSNYIEIETPTQEHDNNISIDDE